MNKFFNTIAEEFSSTWTLLSDTTIFLSRTKVFYKYEADLRNWRKLLQRYPHNTKIFRQVKQEVILLRKTLREEGYNLKLGSKDIVIGGFKSDDSVREGFTRLVLFLTKDDIFYITGEENHLQLARFLGLKLKIENLTAYPHIHNLWYRWDAQILRLCGGDSESQDDFEKLKEIIKANKDFFIKKLRNLP